jgi:hypothetical protein
MDVLRRKNKTDVSFYDETVEDLANSATGET